MLSLLRDSWINIASLLWLESHMFKQLTHRTWPVFSIYIECASGDFGVRVSLNIDGYIYEWWVACWNALQWCEAINGYLAMSAGLATIINKDLFSKRLKIYSMCNLRFDVFLVELDKMFNVPSSHVWMMHTNHCPH